jgi:hypothetical protein
LWLASRASSRYIYFEYTGGSQSGLGAELDALDDAGYMCFDHAGQFTHTTDPSGPGLV